MLDECRRALEAAGLRAMRQIEEVANYGTVLKSSSWAKILAGATLAECSARRAAPPALKS